MPAVPTPIPRASSHSRSGPDPSSGLLWLKWIKHTEQSVPASRLAVSVTRGMSVAQLERIRQQTHTWAHDYLEGLVADIQQQGIAVQKLTIDGRPHTGIAQYAETSQVELIVMSTRGQSGLSRWLMGSVADRILRGATVPVLLVRTRREET